MMVATLRWRDELKVEDLLSEEFPDDIFGKVGYVFGHDVDGRPVTYVVPPFPLHFLVLLAR